MDQKNEWYAEMKQSNNNSRAIKLYTHRAIKQVRIMHLPPTLALATAQLNFRSMAIPQVLSQLHRNVGTILSPEKQHDCAHWR